MPYRDRPAKTCHVWIRTRASPSMGLDDTAKKNNLYYNFNNILGTAGLCTQVEFVEDIEYADEWLFEGAAQS